MRWRRPDPVLAAIDGFGGRMVARLEQVHAELVVVTEEMHVLLTGLRATRGQSD